jgi:adenylate cyclase
MSEPEHTFLFADLVGFTALTDAEGDHRAAAVAAALQTRVRAVSSDHDGEIVKLMGDAVMLRCCDPADSIRLAVRLVSEVERDPGLPPIRVGVHSGSAVNHEGDWYGRAVNVAARLCSVAAGGEVLVSESTLSAAGELPRVAVGERRLHWLKNVTEPVPARTAEPSRESRRVRRFVSHCPLVPGRGGHAAVGGAA